MRKKSLFGTVEVFQFNDEWPQRGWRNHAHSPGWQTLVEHKSKMRWFCWQRERIKSLIFYVESLGVSDILAAEGQRCLTWFTIFTKNGDRPDLSPSRFGTVTNGFWTAGSKLIWEILLPNRAFRFGVMWGKYGEACLGASTNMRSPNRVYDGPKGELKFMRWKDQSRRIPWQQTC